MNIKFYLKILMCFIKVFGFRKATFDSAIIKIIIQNMYTIFIT